MPVAPPLDDPRNTEPPLEQKIADALTEVMEKSNKTLLRGFEAVITGSAAIKGETAETLADLSRQMDVIVRSSTDASVIGKGIGGVAPMSSGDPSARAARALRVRRTSQEAQHTLVTKQPARRPDEVLRTQEPVRSNMQRQAPRPSRADERMRLNYEITPGGSMADMAQETRKGIKDSIYDFAARRVEGMVAEAAPQDEFSDIASRQIRRMAPGMGIDRLGRFHNDKGKFVSAGTAATTVDDAASWRRRAMVGQVGVRTLGAIKAGQPVGRALASALPAGVLKAAGGVGLAVQMGDQALQWAQGQAAENREYQEIYGGSNLEQLDDRGSRWVNKNITGRFSMLGGGNYDKLFGNAMQEGLRGDDRGRYISAGADLMGTGMGSEQVSRLFAEATKAGDSLGGFADAIRKVNDVAKDAGRNASKARDLFIKNYQTANEVMFTSGGSSADMATVLTAAAVGQGREFQGIDQTGTFSGMDRQRYLAAISGQTITEQVVAAGQNPVGMIIQGQDALMKDLNYIRSESGGERNIQEVATAWLAEHPDYDASNAHDQKDLGDYLTAQGFMPDQLLSLAKQHGVQGANESNVAGFIGNLFSDQSAGALAEDEIVAQGERLSPANLGTFTEDEARDYFVNGLNGASPSIRGLQQAYLGGGQGRQGGISEATGMQRSPVIEQLLDQARELGLDDHSTKVLVDTADGRKVVDLKWAIQNVPEQFQAGTVQFMEGAGDSDGQTVAEVLEIGEGVLDPYADAGSESGKEVSGEGQTDYEKYQADRGEEAEEDKPAESVVTFELTPEARRLLQPATATTDPYQNGPPTFTGPVTTAQGNPGGP